MGDSASGASNSFDLESIPNANAANGSFNKLRLFIDPPDRLFARARRIIDATTQPDANDEAE